MVNFRTATETINGVEYKAQFSGMSAALKAADSSYINGSSITSLEKFSEYILKHIIVEPRITIDSFGADKVGEISKKEIDGVEYEAQFRGIRTALKAVDSSYIDGSNNTSSEKFSDFLFKNIIVSPKNLTIDDFMDIEVYNQVVEFARDTMQGGKIMEEFNEVISFGREVMQGSYFRDKEDGGTTPKKRKG